MKGLTAILACRTGTRSWTRVVSCPVSNATGSRPVRWRCPAGQLFPRGPRPGCAPSARALRRIDECATTFGGFVLVVPPRVRPAALQRLAPMRRRRMPTLALTLTIGPNNGLIRSHVAGLYARCPRPLESRTTRVGAPISSRSCAGATGSPTRLEHPRIGRHTQLQRPVMSWNTSPTGYGADTSMIEGVRALTCGDAGGAGDHRSTLRHVAQVFAAEAGATPARADGSPRQHPPATALVYLHARAGRDAHLTQALASAMTGEALREVPGPAAPSPDKSSPASSTRVQTRASWPRVARCGWSWGAVMAAPRAAMRERT